MIARAGLLMAMFSTMVVANAVAQELTHPTNMRLPDSDFERPAPSDYELTLENGLTAYVAESGHVPLVTLSAFVRVGKVDDARQQGSAEVLLDALRSSGPSGLSPDEFAVALKYMTADFVVDMHDEWTELSLNVPTEDLHQAMQIFSDLLRNPAIHPANIERAAGYAKPANDDLAGEDGPALYEGSLNAAVEKFYEVLYTNHPYGSQPVAADFENLQVADVTDFHDDYFVPGNMVLAVAGDIEPDDINALIADHFGDWDGTDAPDAIQMPVVRADESSQHSFPVDKLQSWLVFGHELPQVPLGDQAALEVMNYILAGGHLWTRMTIETRYKYGYTNDASGFLEDKWYGPGAYNFRSYSRPEVIKAIYDNMMEEIIHIRDEKVSDEEMFVAKGALADGSFPIQYLDGYKIVRSFALEKLRYGNHERSASYVARIRAVSTEDVLAAARKYLRPDDMQVILIGQPEDLLD